MMHTTEPQSSAPGYVEVAGEPLHKEFYIDRYFRAYLANLRPGQATAFHRHSEDTLYIVLKGGRMRNQNFKATKRSPMLFPRSFPFYKQLWLGIQNVLSGSAQLPDGLLFFMPTRKHPSIHLAAACPHNRGEVSLMGIELRDRCAHTGPVDISLPGRMEYERDTFKLLACALAPAASEKIALPGCQLFMVCTKGQLEILPGDALAPGAYRCQPGDIPILVSNPGNTPSELLILAVPI
jgi:hypothetical protein